MGDIKGEGILLTIYTINIAIQAFSSRKWNNYKSEADMKTEDENGYRVFPINLGKQLSNKEAYVYLLLLFKSDYNTGESNVLLETLSNEAEYDSDTVSGYLHKAEEHGYVDITRKYIKGEHGEPKTKNFYKVHIPPKDFIMVSRSFLELHFENLTLREETDIKGFILLVKCICLNNCNLTYYSLREMAAHLSLSYGTIQKYMSKCIELNLIERHKGCYRITLDCFDKGNTNYFPKGTPPLYKEIYNTIDLFCRTKGLETPPYKKELIGQIAVEYPYTRQELKQTNDIELIKRYSVKFQLAQRLPDLKELVNSMNYFVKVLTNKDYAIPPKKEPLRIVM